MPTWGELLQELAHLKQDTAKNPQSDSHPVTLDDAIEQGLAVTTLEEDQVLQDRFLFVHHAVRHTLNDTGTTKLIKNHHGRAYLTITRPVVIEQGPPE